MAIPYWKWDGRPGRESRELTPLHEALHAAVTQILGGMAYSITIDDSGGGLAFTDNMPVRWEDIAVWLAPALINDISRGDADYLKHQNCHKRGFAWGWLRKNRRRIMRLANKIAGEMGRPPGELKWDPETTRWKWERRKRK